MEATKEEIVNLRLAAEYETSFSKLNDHDWSIVTSTWARGVDWCVGKLGCQWTVYETFGKRWPLYRTKVAAYEAVTNLVLTESRRRGAIRTLAQLAEESPRKVALR
jgi:hypothetical protein